MSGIVRALVQRRRWLLGAVFALAFGPAARAQSKSTEEVFRQFSDRVIKIEVQETGSAAKAAIGSGFYISKEGHVVTNYHVVSPLVQHPDRYRARVVVEEQEEQELKLLNFDVTHDLALLVTEGHTSSFFSLSDIEPPQGLRLFSLGHPLDLGLNIVEGTYNGFLKHALDKRINFTGSLNPGMSGGPAITAEGQVAGVNVASAGEQVSFLVPVREVIRLYDETPASDGAPADSFPALLRDQVLDWQESFVSTLLREPPPTVQLDGFVLPTKPAPYFNCWADADRQDTSPYEVVHHRCSTDDYIFISPELVSGRVWFYHRLTTSQKLNRFQFSTLYTSDFARTGGRLFGGEEEVTSFRCNVGTVRKDDLVFKVLYCLRRYKRMEGVYDAVFKAAVVGKSLTGLETSLFLSGVSYENAEAVVRWYLGSVSCHE